MFSRYCLALAGWDLTRKDGTVYSFGKGAPLQKIHDRYSNSITITRANGQTGPISQIAASNGRSVVFTYNNAGTVIKSVADNLPPTDPNRRQVNYNYYDQGMLQNASNVTYSYNGSNPLTTYFYGTTDIGNMTQVDLRANDANGSVHANYNYVTRTSGPISTFGPDIGTNGYDYTYTSGSGTCPGTTAVPEVIVAMPDGA